MFLEECVWYWLTVAFDMSECLRVSEFGMGLQSKLELTSEIGGLNKGVVTSGLDVVWLQKVEPVGLIVGGNFDL